MPTSYVELSKPLIPRDERAQHREGALAQRMLEGGSCFHASMSAGIPWLCLAGLWTWQDAGCVRMLSSPYVVPAL